MDDWEVGFWLCWWCKRFGVVGLGSLDLIGRRGKEKCWKFDETRSLCGRSQRVAVGKQKFEGLWEEHLQVFHKLKDEMTCL